MEPICGAICIFDRRQNDFPFFSPSSPHPPPVILIPFPLPLHTYEQELWDRQPQKWLLEEISAYQIETLRKNHFHTLNVMTLEGNSSFYHFSVRLTICIWFVKFLSPSNHTQCIKSYLSASMRWLIVRHSTKSTAISLNGLYMKMKC